MILYIEMNIRVLVAQASIILFGASALLAFIFYLSLRGGIP